MNNLHAALEGLRTDITKMMKMVRKQTRLTYEALVKADKDIPEEIIHRELRINALELQLDAACEQTIALYNPVASDLRFVLAVLSMSSNLERMADLAEGIAKYVKDMDEPFDKELLIKVSLNKAFETALSMIDDVYNGVKQDDTSALRGVFKKDAVLDKINADVTKAIVTLANKHPKKIKDYLFLFSTIKKLERFGDLAENIAEDYIFYKEAEVLKHSANVNRPMDMD